MLTEFLLQFTRIGAEWVLWLLLTLSLICVIIMVERIVFMRGRKLDANAARIKLNQWFDARDYKKAAEFLQTSDSMEARVVLFGLRHHERGAGAVEDLLTGALATEKVRYDKGVVFLGTVGSNAPFIGLFGTVIGIINAFDKLSEGGEEAARHVMSAIAEALVATGVGILVAIPAVMMYNYFKNETKKATARTELLGRSLTSHLRDENGGEDGGV